MNFYLSLGLAFFAAAVSWRGTRRDWILAGALAALSLMAHPMGFPACSFPWSRTFILRNSPPENIACSFSLSVLLSLVAPPLRAAYVSNLMGWIPLKFAAMLNGADQLMVFGAPYRYIALGALVFGSIAFVAAVIVDARRFRMLDRFRTPLSSLWVIFVFAIAMLPGVIWFPQYAAAVSAILSRLTAVTAILGLCVLGAVWPRRWIFAGLALLAVVFFAFEYHDTGSARRKWSVRVETLVAAVPYGARVELNTIDLAATLRG